MAEPERRTLRIEETARVPWDAVIMGWGPVIPFPAAAIWLSLGGPDALIGWAQVWGSAIALFLSGVRRGLSFRMPGGWTWTQMAVFAWLFWAGLAALVLPSGPALAVLTLIYASLAFLDPVSAERGETPLWFRRLRPGQMSLAAIGLFGLWWQA